MDGLFWGLRLVVSICPVDQKWRLCALLCGYDFIIFVEFPTNSLHPSYQFLTSFFVSIFVSFRGLTSFLDFCRGNVLHTNAT